MTISGAKSVERRRWNSDKGAYDVTLISGTITLEFNVDAIMSQLAAKALFNRTGEAHFMNGLIKASVTNRKETVK